MKMLLQTVLVVCCVVSLSLANPLAGEGRIVNGDYAELYGNPSIISLQARAYWFTDFRHICGGVIISRNKILTAAHCVEGQSSSNMRIKAGALNIHDSSQATNYQHYVNVQSYVMHNRYNVNGNGIPNDIAVITLSSNLDLGGNVQVAQLAPRGSSFAGQTCRIAGWGMTSGTGSGASHLKEAYIPKIDNAECNNIWPGMILNTHICVYDRGSHNDVISACMGDSGGPMYCGNNYELLAGLTSWGEGTCSGSRPSVYTRVSEYLDWINNQM